MYTISCFYILILSLSCLKQAYPYSFMDMSQYDTQNSDNSLSDWDSGLYGKPICINVPSNMSLCQNINYNQMKMPNLLGHDTIEEVVYQSSVWTPLLSINCHKDAQMFLCSMFAPVCVPEANAVILPCRSLCESVKQSCEGPMLSYNYPWPSMFNCSKFPEDNGLCMQTSNKMVMAKQSEDTTTTSVSTTVQTTSVQSKLKQISTKPRINNKKEDNAILGDQTCFGCDEDNLNMEQIVYGYCKSDIVLRGRIQTIKISKLDLTNLKLREKNLYNRMNKTRSLYIKISKRERKLVKGAKLVSPSFLNSYVNENSDLDGQYENSRDLNMYLVSNVHLRLSGQDGNRGAQSRDPSLTVNKKKVRTLKEAGSVGVRQNNQASRKRFANINHCVCEKLRKGARRINTKYLITGNVLRSRSLQVSNVNRVNRRDLKSVDEIGLNSTNVRSVGALRSKNFSKKWVNSNNEREESKDQTKLIYLTNVVQWNKARAFIDYLEDDSIDKTHMCKNIKKTVSQISRAQNLLF